MEELRSKQVPEETISDECRWCAENEPEWSPDANCWIHRRPTLDKRCLRKYLSPVGTGTGGPGMDESAEQKCAACDRGEKATTPPRSSIVGSTPVHYPSGNVCLKHIPREEYEVLMKLAASRIGAKGGSDGGH